MASRIAAAARPSGGLRHDAAQERPARGGRLPEGVARRRHVAGHEGAADAADEDRRSSLASAAGGALISPVRGRRKKEAPAFDWGQSDSSDNAGGAAAGSDEDENVKKLGDTLRGLFNK